MIGDALLAAFPIALLAIWRWDNRLGTRRRARERQGRHGAPSRMRGQRRPLRDWQQETRTHP